MCRDVLPFSVDDGRPNFDTFQHSWTLPTLTHATAEKKGGYGDRRTLSVPEDWYVSINLTQAPQLLWVVRLSSSEVGRGHSPAEGQGGRQQPRHGFVHPLDRLRLESVRAVVPVRRGVPVGSPHLEGVLLGALQAHESRHADEVVVMVLRARARSRGRAGREGFRGIVASPSGGEAGRGGG